jgi:hypothetical protein
MAAELAGRRAQVASTLACPLWTASGKPPELLLEVIREDLFGCLPSGFAGTDSRTAQEPNQNESGFRCDCEQWLSLNYRKVARSRLAHQASESLTERPRPLDDDDRFEDQCLDDLANSRSHQPSGDTGHLLQNTPQLSLLDLPDVADFKFLRHLRRIEYARQRDDLGLR